MPSISLSTHVIRVRKRFDRSSSSLRFGDVANGRGLRAVVVDFLESLRKDHSHDEESKYLQNVTDLDTNGSSIWGFIRAGDYGYEATGVSSKTLQTSYTRSPDDAEMIPFFFLLHLPDDVKRGILVLQRLGSRGVQTPFCGELRRYFGNASPEHIIEINPAAPPEVIQYLTNGSIKKVTVTKYHLPKDVADMVGLRGFPEQEAKYTVSMEAKKDRFLGAPEWLKEYRQKTTLHELRGIGELDEEISLTMVLQGKQRTVSLARPEKITPYIDVTDRVEQHKGHPVLASILPVAQELARAAAEGLGLPE